MKKSSVVGAIGFALLASSALAQSTDTTTVMHSSTVAPADGTYKSKKTERVIDNNGVETEKSQAYVRGANGTSARSSVRTTAPDGSVVNETQEGRTVSPDGDTTTTTHSVTKEQ